MKSIITLILFLFVCASCYAAPGIIRHPDGSFDTLIYLGQIPFNDSNANIYTTRKSIDTLLNDTSYNKKDWSLYIYTEPLGNTRQKVADGLKESDVSWLNTTPGSRAFWAVSNPVHTKDNIMTVHPQENIYDDHGELMGARNAGRADIVNLADDNAAAMKALDRVVLDFLNREFAKRKANQK